jgi:hypothetical protein
MVSVRVRKADVVETYAILSGCPSPTDSEVNRKVSAFLATPLVTAVPVMVNMEKGKVDVGKERERKEVCRDSGRLIAWREGKLESGRCSEIYSW